MAKKHDIYRSVVTPDQLPHLIETDLISRIHGHLEAEGIEVDGVSLERIAEISGARGVTERVEGPFITISADKDPTKAMESFNWDQTPDADDTFLKDLHDRFAQEGDPLSQAEIEKALSIMVERELGRGR